MSILPSFCRGRDRRKKILLGLHFLLADAEWNALDETELRVSAWPVWEDDLANPERTLNPDFFQNMTKEGIEWKWRWHEILSNIWRERSSGLKLPD